MNLPVQGAEDVLCGVNLPALTFLNQMLMLHGVLVVSTVYIPARIKLYHMGL